MQSIDQALRSFGEGNPAAMQTVFSQRMANVMTTVILMLGTDYTWGNAWDNYPQRCQVVFNVGRKDVDGVTYRLFCETHRNLMLWSDAQLVNTWTCAIRRAFEEPEAARMEKSQDNGCI